ncbi:DUF6311 domain-containing protein [Thiocapsa sp.]|uniref:DUF6311 domain-containing protein n=2 Tax=Thiocapsa sp. TaxID=2024551 RepID=UPI00345C2ED7
MAVAGIMNKADPTNVGWLMTGDLGQHFTGWHAFRFDAWRFPITTTTLIAWPVGIPIIFTDSNPLFALVLKPFSSILPEQFQYIGPWYALCLVLQSFFAYLLGFRISSNRLFAVAVALLFLLYPPLLTRWGHDTLMAHWLILWAISLYLYPTSSAGDKSIHVQGIAIIILSTVIHFYLTAMVFPLIIGVILFGPGSITRKVLSVVAALFLLFGIMALLGYFSLESAGSAGFGYYSMNLNSPFNPAGLSHFLPSLPTGPGQYEGYQYLGVGGLMMLTVAGGLLAYAVFSKGRTLSPISHRTRFLILYGIAATLFAISLPAMLGDRVVVAFTLPEYINSALGVFRSSGRFFWPVAYLLYVGALVVIWRRARPIAVPLLLALCIIQFIDLIPLRAALSSAFAREQAHDELGPTLTPLLGDADAIHADGSWEKKQSAMYRGVLLGAPLGVPVIPVYSARSHLELGAWENEFREHLARGHASTRNILGIYPSGWYVCAPGRSFLTIDDWVLMLPDRTVDSAAIRYTVDQIAQGSAPNPEQLIAGCGSDCALLIAAQDEASASLPAALVDALHMTGSEIDRMGFRDSYLIVVENGVILHEDFGQRPLIHTTRVLGRDVAIESAGNTSGNRSSIKVDGIEYSHQRRGLNMVLIAPDKPISAFSYDTHAGVCR